MNDVEWKRQAIYDAYKSSSWHDRVRQMSDAQIIAIYFSLKRQGKV